LQCTSYLSDCASYNPTYEVAIGFTEYVHEDEDGCSAEWVIDWGDESTTRMTVQRPPGTTTETKVTASHTYDSGRAMKNGWYGNWGIQATHIGDEPDCRVHFADRYFTLLDENCAKPDGANSILRFPWILGCYLDQQHVVAQCAGQLLTRGIFSKLKKLGPAYRSRSGLYKVHKLEGDKAALKPAARLWDRFLRAQIVPGGPPGVRTPRDLVEMFDRVRSWRDAAGGLLDLVDAVGRKDYKKIMMTFADIAGVGSCYYAIRDYGFDVSD
jgi:hypothetical protein